MDIVIFSYVNLYIFKMPALTSFAYVHFGRAYTRAGTDMTPMRCWAA